MHARVVANRLTKLAMAKPRTHIEKSETKSDVTRSRSSRPQGPATFAEGELSPDHAEVEVADLIDDAIPTRGYQMLPMVGLGGSAGSIQALQTFFRAMPADTGLVFVVILHLSSEHESTLAQLLQRSTKMPVVQVNATANGRAQSRLRDPARQATRGGRWPFGARRFADRPRPAPSRSICSSARWPTRMVRTRRRSCCPAPTVMARSESSASRSAVG